MVQIIINGNTYELPLKGSTFANVCKMPPVVVIDGNIVSIVEAINFLVPLIGTNDAKLLGDNNCDNIAPEISNPLINC